MAYASSPRPVTRPPHLGLRHRGTARSSLRTGRRVPLRRVLPRWAAHCHSALLSIRPGSAHLGRQQWCSAHDAVRPRGCHRIRGVSPDGRRMVSASADHTARIWDALSGAQLSVLSGHNDAVFSAAFSHDGGTSSPRRSTTPFASGTPTTLHNQSCSTLTVMSQSPPPCSPPMGNASSWRTATGRRVSSTQASERSSLSYPAIAQASTPPISPDGQRIVTASGDRTGISGTRKPAGRSPCCPATMLNSFPRRSPPTEGASSPRTKTEPRASGTRPTARLAVLSGHSVSRMVRRFRPTGGKSSPQARINGAHLGCGSGRQVTVLSGHSGIVTTSSFSPDGRRVVTASLDGTARIWSADNGQIVVVLSGHGGGVTDGVFTQRGAHRHRRQ